MTPPDDGRPTRGARGRTPRNTRDDIRRKQRLRETAYRRAVEEAFKAEQTEKAQAQPKTTSQDK